MNLYNQGLSCNVNADILYEQAMSEGVINFEDYPEFIDTRMTLQAQQMPM